MIRAIFAAILNSANFEGYNSLRELEEALQEALRSVQVARKAKPHTHRVQCYQCQCHFEVTMTDERTGGLHGLPDNCIACYEKLTGNTSGLRDPQFAYKCLDKVE